MPRVDGQCYLIVRSGPTHWLPWWAAPLIQEIDDGEFADDLAIAREEYDSRWALRHAAYYRVATDSVRPRYGFRFFLQLVNSVCWAKPAQ